MTLTDQEREKFAVWLEQHIASNKTILVQMEKVKVPAILLQQYRGEIAAATVVVNMLRAIEKDEIG